MFGFGKQKMGYKTVRDERWGDYEGKGIWAPCDCGNLHEVEQDHEFVDVMEEQCCAIGDSSQALYNEFFINELNGRWDVVPSQARFTFTRENGQQCHARYGVVGSYNQVTHSWMWAWHFPEGWEEKPALQVANRLCDLGVDKNWQPLIEPILFVNDHEAWHMAKLAAWASGYPMVYRAPVNEKNYQYFAIDRPVWLT